MQSIDLIRENLARSEAIVLSRIEEMRECCLVSPTPQGGCHTLWVLGHLAFIEAMVIQGIMRGRPNPLVEWEAMFDDAEISGDAKRFPPFDQVLDTCRRMRASTIARLDASVESDLDVPAANLPEGAANLFGTRRQCFQYAADHWYMHRGQLAEARRAAGLRRMWF